MNARTPSLPRRVEQQVARLGSAAEARDWPAAAAADRELRALAAELAARAYWAAADHQALERGRAGLRAAIDAVAVEQRRLAEDMAQFNRCRAGWVAYAMHDEARSEA